MFYKALCIVVPAAGLSDDVPYRNMFLALPSNRLPGRASRFILHRDRLLALIQPTGLPGRARTCDPLIKSQLLCQLSYGE